MIDLSLLQDFIAESEEHLEEMEAALLKLESEPDNHESLNDVFRTVHSIKGSAEYIGLEKTARLSHKLENLLEAVRQGEKKLNDTIINTLMDARDRLLMLIADLDNDKEEKIDISDILKQIENLSDDNGGNEDVNCTNEGDDEIIELANAAVEPPVDDGIIEAANIVDEICRDGGDEIIELIDIIDDSSCKNINVSPHPLFGDDVTETSQDISITPHPLFGDGATDMSPEIEKCVIYEEDNDEELFDIFLEHLKENFFSIKGLITGLPASDNRGDLLVKFTNAILSLKSSANYMDFTELVELYEEWIAWVEKFQEGMFLADGIGFENFFKSVKNYMDQVAAFFPSHKELCIDLDVSNHELIEAELKETEVKALEKIAPDDSVDASVGLEGEAEELEKEDEDEACLLEEESAVDQDSGKTVNDPDTLDDGLSVSVKDGEDMPVAGKGEADFFTEEPDEEQIDSSGDVFIDIFEEDCREEDSGDVCYLSEEQDSVFLESRDPSEGDEAEPEVFTGDIETGLSDYGESASSDADEETDLTPLSETGIVSEAINQGINKVEEPEEIYPSIGQDVFMQDLQAEPEPIKTVADKRDLPETKIIKQIVRQSVRVDAGKIDALMNQAGELVVSRAGFSQILNEMKELQQYLRDNGGVDQKEFKQFKDLAFRLGEATATLGRVANELQEGVMKVRMLPISQLFNRYPRLVRDLVHDINKKVRLEIAGEETELDKMVIQEIADPMVHIIRNAVDHGIETVPERLKAGKPEEGVLKLTSYHESNHVVVEIIDDGRGINPDLIRTVALKKGLFSDQELKRMTTKDLIGILMLPGFSTASKVSTTSGRGVGMDVVKQNIEKLNGTIEIDSKPGSGSRLRIKIPLTLAIIKALMVRVGGDIFTIPLASVEETRQILSRDISIIEGIEVIQLRDSVLSLMRLSSFFRIDAAAQVAGKEFVVVINTGMRQVGLIVDALLGQEEVVIKPLADYLQDNSGFSGATILGDGSISLILDVYELINMSMDMQSARRERLKSLDATVDRFNQSSAENYEWHPIH